MALPQGEGNSRSRALNWEQNRIPRPALLSTSCAILGQRLASSGPWFIICAARQAITPGWAVELD